MHKRNVLIIGSGGREHALAWKIVQSSLLNKLFIAPGNAGTGFTGINIPVSGTDFEAVKCVVLENDIDVVIVGPEDPLVQGIADFFESDNLLQHVILIGPGKNGAQLEGSKDFAKQFMVRHSIPTAAYGTFTAKTFDEGLDFLKKQHPPYVLKADGLAAGKGVVICNTYEDASEELHSMLKEAKFGKASTKVVVEEFLDGIELSVFVVTDGVNYQILPEAKDYKRVGEGDSGPNTGGMGSVSPVPFAGKDFMQKVEERIIKPTVAGLAQEQIPYKGFIFFGLMNVKGNPYVIEYNVRMGDPETEVVMPRIKSDLLELLINLGEGKLTGSKIEFDSKTAVAVMMVSGGYPGNYEKGKAITGLDNDELPVVFHAGTTYQEGDRMVITSGGRVLAVTALGDTHEIAREKAFNGVSRIHFEGAYYRRDIGLDLM
jgi:phosphoribosylamine--glycine ligase